jgi:hypothetical protein
LRVIPYWGEISFGLPSGHALTGAGLWGLLAALFRQKWFTRLMVGIIFMIGLSRIFLGVHFLTDVLAGWLLGFLLVMGFIKWQRPVAQWIGELTLIKTSLLILVISLSILGISFLVIQLQTPWNPSPQWIQYASRSGETPDPLNPNAMVTLAGTFLGLSLGAAWMYHSTGLPKRSKSITTNLIRYVLGITGTALLWFGLSAVLPKSADFIGILLRYLRYALVGLWVAGIAPWIFHRIEHKRLRETNNLD